MNICDKCGRPVPHENDVRNLRVELSGPTMMGWEHFVFGCAPKARHLLPVVEGEKTVCMGSPSRAQYLEGQPRDSRPEYPYDPKKKAIIVTHSNKCLKRWRHKLKPHSGTHRKRDLQVSGARYAPVFCFSSIDRHNRNSLPPHCFCNTSLL